MATHTVQSVSRAIDILETLAQSPQGLSLSSLADQLELKTPTLHHLLQTLAVRGFVEKIDRPTRYRLGPGPSRISAVQEQAEHESAIRQAMTQLALDFPGSTVIRARFLGGEIVATMRLSPENPTVIQFPPHQIMSPYSSASALAFQAFADEEQRMLYTGRYPFDEFAAHYWHEPGRLDSFLAEVRREGVCVMPDSTPMIRLAVPSVGSRGQFEAVIGISMAVHADVDPTLLKSQLVMAAKDAAHVTKQ